MYKHYYGLKKNPFDPISGSGALFLSETHKEGLATLKYGLLSRKGFVLLTGEVGSGKTTLINVLANRLGPNFLTCVLANPILSPEEFFFFIASKYDVSFSGKAKFLLDFEKMLKGFSQKKQKVLLIIDEAHLIPVELLEEIRLLSNLADQANNGLSIFLVGQPELLGRLEDKRLLPLRQRIGIRYHLEPFSFEESIHYILFRLQKAGAANTQIFSEKAIEAIYKTTKGNPRLINTICDHALLTGYSYEKLTIDEEIVLECVAEFNLQKDIVSPAGRTARPNVKQRRAVLYIIASFMVLLAALAAAGYVFRYY